MDDEDDAERNFMRNLSDDGKCLIMFNIHTFLACKVIVNF